MDDVFVWRAPEYDDTHKSRDWFGVVGTIGIGGAILATILGNLLFAVLLVIATAALILEGVRRPKIIEFQIDKRGARAGNVLYPFKTLESFWIEVEDVSPKLLIKSQKTIMPLIVFPISEDINLENLHSFLSEQLEEEPLEEPFFEQLLKRFGF